MPTSDPGKIVAVVELKLPVLSTIPDLVDGEVGIFAPGTYIFRFAEGPVLSRFFAKKKGTRGFALLLDGMKIEFIPEAEEDQEGVKKKPARRSKRRKYGKRERATTATA